ncbi:MAG: DUF2975 domain-containing protein [Acetivibrio sp.]
MNQKSLSRWLKTIIAGMVVCGGILYLYAIPLLGRDAVASFPEYANCYEPWLWIIWGSGIPCYLVLYFGWKIVTEIEKDNSFSMINAKYLKKISILALADSAYFFVANLIFMMLGMNHPGLFLGSLFVVFAGVAVAVVTAALSHLVQKAAKLKEENELTI